MDITVTEIEPGERAAFANLMKMYCYEWSQYNLFDVDAEGVYPFERVAGRCFELPNRWNYLIRADGVLAGFALVDDDFAYSLSSDYSMGEFFVMHKYRRQGVGRIAATRVFDLHRGVWEVGFHPNNLPSVEFWPRVVGAYAGGAYTLHERCPELAYHDGTLGSVLTFDNGAARAE